VVIPTYGRPHLLRRCLAGVERQEPPPEEVVVVYRPEDEATVEVLRAWLALDPAGRRMVSIDRPGIVPALLAGTAAARSEVVAYLDDDAVARPGWLRAIADGFLDLSVGAVGGRFVDHVDGRPVTGGTNAVGRITWYGRVIGRHHLDTDYRGDVEFLAGTNWALRRIVAHHDEGLLHASNGLAVGNELDSCLTARRLGWRIVFTPESVVDHVTTSVRETELGSRVAGRDVFTSAANYTYALLKYLPPFRRLSFRAYAYLVGSSMLPGPGRMLVEAFRSPRRSRAMAARIPNTWRGRRMGGRMYRRWRGEPAGAQAPSQDAAVT
jgi:glycosyltransferase involved in cell wall biosynthesis